MSSALSSACDFKSHFCKQCGHRSRSSLIKVHTVCLYAKIGLKKLQEYSADDINRQHFQMQVFLAFQGLITFYESSNLECFIYHKRYKEMQTKLMDELENTKSNGTKRLRAATEESNILKTQLEQLAEDSARQKQSLSAEMHRLHGENRQLKSR